MNTNKPYAWINVNDEYKILFDIIFLKFMV